MTLVMSFDLEVNGYSEERFRDNPGPAMRTMLRRAQEFLDQQNLTMRNDRVYDSMARPIARLSGWPAPDLDL